MRNMHCHDMRKNTLRFHPAFVLARPSVHPLKHAQTRSWTSILTFNNTNAIKTHAQEVTEWMRPMPKAPCQVRRAVPSMFYMHLSQGIVFVHPPAVDAAQVNRTKRCGITHAYS